MIEKRPAPAPTSFPDAGSLRVGIVHARWNTECIDALVKGAVSSLEKAGVKTENIIIESVPGSFELPVATSRYVPNFLIWKEGRPPLLVLINTLHFHI